MDRLHAGIAKIKEEPDEEQEELPKTYTGKTRKTAADHRIRRAIRRSAGLNSQSEQRTHLCQLVNMDRLHAGIAKIKEEPDEEQEELPKTYTGKTRKIAADH
jgi:hypothetical protein